MLFEGVSDLGEEFFFERLEEEVACPGDSAADDDGFGVEEEDGGGEGAGELCGDAVPDFESHFVAFFGGVGEGLGGAVVEGEALAGFAVEFAGARDDLVVADVFFEAAVIPVGAGAPFVVDGDVAEFSSDGVGAAGELAVDNDSATDPGAKGESDEVIHSLAGAHFPFGISHRVGVVVDGRGKG